jgi:hypothetical protein
MSTKTLTMHNGKTATDPFPQCRTCRYSLHLNQSATCPECGTTFNPDDPDTYPITSPVEAHGVKNLRRMSICRNANAFLFIPSLLASCAYWKDASLWLLELVTVSAILTLHFQTRAAYALLSKSESWRFFWAAILLLPLGFLGPLVIPSLVSSEVRLRILARDSAAAA